MPRLPYRRPTGLGHICSRCSCIPVKRSATIVDALQGGWPILASRLNPDLDSEHRAGRGSQIAAGRLVPCLGNLAIVHFQGHLGGPRQRALDDMANIDIFPTAFLGFRLFSKP